MFEPSTSNEPVEPIVKFSEAMGTLSEWFSSLFTSLPISWQQFLLLSVVFCVFAAVVSCIYYKYKLFYWGTKRIDEYFKDDRDP